MTLHLWCVGRYPGDADLEVDCHRLLRGPYTGVGTVLRALVPAAHQRSPELVRKHAIEILSAAPELKTLIGPARETLTSLAIPTERTRIYPANRTRRLAHGITEFLLSAAALAGRQPLTVAFRNVDDADHTDQEFLAIALRRARPDRLRIVVGLRGADLPAELAPALERYARRTEGRPAAAGDPDRDQDVLLQAFIEADGTSTDPAEHAAYRAADPATRAARHDARAEQLRLRAEWTLHLGAIPYHLEHGSDPTGAGGDALYEAAKYCGSMGFYHAITDYGRRGRPLTDPDTQMERYWLLSTRASTALAVLGDSIGAEPTYHELRRRYATADLQLATGYALGMLYTRFHPPGLKDHEVAREYLMNSATIATLLPDEEQRAFHTVFQNNGIALVEMHEGNLPGALRLVDAGIARLDRELPGDKYRLHRSVLVHNRGKVYAALGRFEESLADLSAVIELDPNYPDYYFDRADVKRKVGDLAGALADCDTAISITPPFYELHYNRADIRLLAGDLAGAVADLRYVVELEPDQLDARVNLVSLLIDVGEVGEAGRHLDAGLRLTPGEARLLHLRGQVALEQGDTAAARADFDRALAADPALVAALASRAAVHYEASDHDAAAADLSAALRAEPDNPDLWHNRGLVHQEAGRWRQAAEDYTRALELTGADETELRHQLALCQARLTGELAGAEARGSNGERAGAPAGVAPADGAPANGATAGVAPADGAPADGAAARSSARAAGELASTP